MAKFRLPVWAIDNLNDLSRTCGVTRSGCARELIEEEYNRLKDRGTGDGEKRTINLNLTVEDDICLEAIASFYGFPKNHVLAWLIGLDLV